MCCPSVHLSLPSSSLIEHWLASSCCQRCSGKALLAGGRRGPGREVSGWALSCARGPEPGGSCGLVKASPPARQGLLCSEGFNDSAGLQLPQRGGLKGKGNLLHPWKVWGPESSSGFKANWNHWGCKSASNWIHFFCCFMNELTCIQKGFSDTVDYSV